jgi:hypothetical protein
LERPETERPKRDHDAPAPLSFADEFDGNALSSSWSYTSWESRGGGPPSIRVAEGILSLAGAQVGSIKTYSELPVEGRLQFGAAPYQHFGLDTGFDTPASQSWAIFSTAATTETLFARVALTCPTRTKMMTCSADHTKA